MPSSCICLPSSTAINVIQQLRDFGETRPEVQNSLGSGVILSADGIVVSNYHVVGQATDIRIVLNDRREFSARVLLADQEATDA